MNEFDRVAPGIVPVSWINGGGLTTFGRRHEGRSTLDLMSEAANETQVDIDLVERRLKIAQQDYEARYGKAKR